MKGSYDSYTEKFIYRTEDEIGHLRSSSLSAPCHTVTRSLVAYACFGGLVSSREEMQNVESAFEDIILEDDDFGFHISPLQLAATQLVCRRTWFRRASAQKRNKHSRW